MAGACSMDTGSDTVDCWGKLKIELEAGTCSLEAGCEIVCCGAKRDGDFVTSGCEAVCCGAKRDRDFETSGCWVDVEFRFAKGLFVDWAPNVKPVEGGCGVKLNPELALLLLPNAGNEEFVNALFGSGASAGGKLLVAVPPKLAKGFALGAGTLEEPEKPPNAGRDPPGVMRDFAVLILWWRKLVGRSKT